ncbi:HFM1-DNA RNA helicase [Fusarium pseudocircinatum]|uniref:HFM1-DNA RNA helicase n=1 Tax=Fusarium pseudocircinatum TaxID=56676 RepID=A0A8H5L3B1_9HYPO|nr:HFM1-DNA RNA helicase [Fusarium pseudocircinatum]
MAEAQQAASSPQTLASETSNEIQKRYEISTSTFKILCKIKSKPDARDILRNACSATEFKSFPMKKEETAFFRAINDNTGIPYQVKEFISQPWHKVYLLVQIDLLKTGWPNKLSGPSRKELTKELSRMYKLLDHVLRCLADILGERGDGKGVYVALEVLRCVKAGIWEGSDSQLLQIEGIGQAKKDKLVKANIKNIKQLSKVEFYNIERILSRNPPFGQTILHKVAGFPRLTLDFEIIGPYIPDATANSKSAAPQGDNLSAVDTEKPSQPLWIARAVLGFDNEKLPHWKGRTPWLTLLVQGDDGRLVWFWRGSAKKLVDKKEMIIGLGAKRDEKLQVSFACEEIVGTLIKKDIRVSV